VTIRPTVIKFGGTSVADARAFGRAAQIVGAQRGARPVVVTSAMSRVTDALLNAVGQAAGGDAEAAAQTLDEHFARHREVACELLQRTQAHAFDAALEAARRDIAGLLREVAEGKTPRPALQDAVVSYGERLAATLLAAVLSARGLPARYVDARRLIVTDDEHGRAAPLMEETARRTRDELGPVIADAQIPVTGGFIGATLEGTTTTLGRGGSDYTAAIVGAGLAAREIQIWTDVSGVLTADPRVVRGAHTVPRLSYSEAAELAYFGAKVLHPKTIQPATEQRTPVRICNSHAPGEAGTVVCAESEASPRTVKAIAHKEGITTVQVTSARMLGAYGFLRALFEIFDRHRTVVDVVTTSEVSVSLSLDDASTLPALIPELKRLGTVEIEEGRAIICVVGEGLRHTAGVGAEIFAAIRDINVSLISLGASSVNLTFAVDSSRVHEAVRRLHAALFGEGEAQLKAAG
jgi:aspartate kinase